MSGIVTDATGFDAVGTIFSVQRFSTRDGPGIRTTVFFKGCPLHCPWCHNPESLKLQPEVAVIESRCIQCGECTVKNPGGEKIAAGTLVGPGCAETVCLDPSTCPTGAREVVGRQWSVTEVSNAILRDRVFFDGSGGGVTFSGGEPLAQPLFLEQCLRASAVEGIHTAVDTSGSCSQTTLLRIAKVTDLFLFDLKPLVPDLHQELIGVPFRSIVANLESLAENHDCIWLRVPIIPGYTDDRSRLAEIRSLALRLPAVRSVALLPFHATGTGKHERLGRGYDRSDFEVPDEELLQLIVSDFESAGLDVTVGG